MQPRMVGDWLVVPYDGHDLAVVHITVVPVPSGDDLQPNPVPAFLDWVDGQRVAKVKHTPTGQRCRVVLTVNGGAARTSELATL